MAKGGARSNSGPPPDPQALRRDRAEDQAGWKTLPAEGRRKPAPRWPLSRQTAREKTLWTAEWKRPQAVEWERNGQEIEVALYVRTLVAAENPKAPAALRTLVKQQQEALGLSLPGLARNRWKIAATAEQPASAPAVKRAGFTVVKGGAA